MAVNINLCIFNTNRVQYAFKVMAFPTLKHQGKLAFFIFWNLFTVSLVKVGYLYVDLPIAKFEQ